jgi:AcrR family transcriptional regulator
MREKRREATIERIVETALRLLETEGFEALTIQRLAKELDYAVGALYRYFRSKDALLVALLQRIMDRIGADVAAGLEWLDSKGGASPRSGVDEGLMRLLVLSTTYVGFAQRRPAEYGLISTMIGDPREFLATEEAAPVVPGLIRMQLLLASVLDEAADAGALEAGDARERGVVLWAAMQGVLQLRKLGRFGVAGVELDGLVPVTLRTLLRGWGADPARLDELTPRAFEIADELARQRAAESLVPEPTIVTASSADADPGGPP